MPQGKGVLSTCTEMGMNEDMSKKSPEGLIVDKRMEKGIRVEVSLVSMTEGHRSPIDL